MQGAHEVLHVELVRTTGASAFLFGKPDFFFGDVGEFRERRGKRGFGSGKHGGADDRWNARSLRAPDVPGGADHRDKAGFEPGCGVDGKGLPLQRVGCRNQDLDRLACLQRLCDPVVDARACLLALMPVAILIEAGPETVQGQADIDDDVIDDEGIYAGSGRGLGLKPEGAFWVQCPVAKILESRFGENGPRRVLARRRRRSTSTGSRSA
jgi:hypothetical protein